MLKVGVLGAGHLGRIHIKLLNESRRYELAGFYDPDPTSCERAVADYGVKAYDSLEALIAAVDVVDIVTPTLSHYDCALKALEAGKHIFIEKPLTDTVEQGAKLVDVVNHRGLKAQVGHVERFNPAYIVAQRYDLKPKFIEAHRLSEFSPRGTDVPVVLDLMIHDLDIVLNLVKAPVEHVSASGVSVLSDQPDIASVRLDFADGSSANLTASRVTLKRERKMRLFQPNGYITIDFLNKEFHKYSLKDVDDRTEEDAMIIEPAPEKQKEVLYEAPEVPPVNAILHELELFADAIEDDTRPVVPIEDGFNALRLAHQIMEIIRKKGLQRAV